MHLIKSPFPIDFAFWSVQVKHFPKLPLYDALTLVLPGLDFFSLFMYLKKIDESSRRPLNWGVKVVFHRFLCIDSIREWL